MAANAFVRARIDEDLKNQAADVLAGRFAVFPYSQPRDSRSYGGVSGRRSVYRVTTYRRNHSDKPVS
jgi:hypothetical protein